MMETKSNSVNAYWTSIQISWLPLIEALRTLDFDLTDEEELHKLLQSAEGYSLGGFI